jgi:hypothetical protein
MTTLTEIVAAVVLHSSAAAFSHFGVVLEPPEASPAPAEQRVVARSPRKVERLDKVQKAAACPDGPKAHVIKA